MIMVRFGTLLFYRGFSRKIPKSSFRPHFLNIINKICEGNQGWMMGNKAHDSYLNWIDMGMSSYAFTHLSVSLRYKI